MLSYRNIARIALITTLLGGLRCSQSPFSSNGTGSTTETGMITGMLYNKDGSPAKNARVYLRNKKFLPKVAISFGNETVAPDSAVAITNETGKFSIDSVDTGTYVMVGTDGGNNMALKDSVPVKSRDSAIKLAPDTLKPAGAIKGVINLSDGGDPRKVFVLVYGTDKFASVNSDGTFKVTGLGEGKYGLRIVSFLDNYDILDTFAIPIKSIDTTNLDTIRLRYTGVPIPNGLNFSYDSLLQVVKITWNKTTTGTMVQSYNIYRKCGDSANYVVIKTGLTDTVFIDTTVLPDQIYKFGVAVIDTNNSTGAMSATITVLAATYFPMDTMFRSPGALSGQFAVDRNGTIYVAKTFSRIQVYDSNTTYKFEIDSNITGASFDVDSAGNIYDYGYDSQHKGAINVWNSKGTFLKSIATGSSGPIYLCIHHDELFCIADASNGTGEVFVKIMDLNGSLKRSWQIANPNEINVNSSNEVFIRSDSNIQIYDSMGNFKSSITHTGFKPVGKVAFDSKGRTIVNNRGSELLFFDKNNIFIGKRKLPGTTANFGTGICTLTLTDKDFIYVALADLNKILKLSDLLP